MNILENNLNVLSRLYEQFPESFNGLTVDGDYLVYGNKRTDISQFSLERLVNENEAFAASLSVLSPDDIFRIIKLHTEMIKSPLELDAKGLEQNNEEKLELIKTENSLMKNVNITTRNKNGYNEEFITIVDSNGTTHMFRNDYKTNIFAIYEMLKYRHPGQDITPDEFIQEINRKLHEVALDDESRFREHDDVSEDFENKMRRAAYPYREDKMHKVMGNQENDIAVVQDLHSDGKDTHIITFDSNEHGDLVLESHKQNVTGVDTSYGEEEKGFEGSVNNETDYEVKENEKEEETIRLISSQEFYALLDSPAELTEEQRKNVDLYYAYLGDLVIYEDYLLDELKAILNSFRAYVNGLQNRVDELNEALNSKQQEAIDKSIEFEVKKNENTEHMDYEKVDENVRKLVLKNPDVNRNYDNAASASIIQVVAIVIGVSIILTAVTLYLLG